MTDPLKLAIFDVDGTLVDSQNHIYAAIAHAFADTPFPCPDRAAVLSIVGLSLPEAFAVLVPEADAAANAMLVDRYKSSFASAREGGTVLSPLYPGALDALDTLGAVDDILLGVATGKSRRGLNHVLATHNLAGRFVTEQVSDHHPSKPHPSMLLAALSETGVDERQAVMIGDTEFDIAMAHAAGLRSIAVAWGYHSADRLEAAKPDAIIHAYGELIPTLNAIWGEEI